VKIQLDHIRFTQNILVFDDATDDYSQCLKGDLASAHFIAATRPSQKT
jgi:hypothetical protein